MGHRIKASSAVIAVALTTLATVTACVNRAPNSSRHSSTTTSTASSTVVSSTTTNAESSAIVTSTPQSALPTLTVGGWTGREPAAIYFSGDAGDIATGLTWSSWTTDQAVARGTRNELGCVPNCAQGTATPYPVTITLSKPVNGRFTFLAEQTADAKGTTETFSAPYLGQGACSTSSDSSCVFS